MTITPEKSNSSSDILWLAKSLTNSTVGKIFIWFALLLLANQTFGDPMGKFMDHRFQLSEAQQNNTYDLQKTTLEFIQNDVMSKLDDIYKRLDNVENDIDNLEREMIKVNDWITDHE